jgi:hypothetical protein
MYTRLTKVVNIAGQEYVTCKFHGTHLCRIHNDGIPNCAHCEMYAAILNQLKAFEDAMEDDVK